MTGDADLWSLYDSRRPRTTRQRPLHRHYLATGHYRHSTNNQTALDGIILRTRTQRLPFSGALRNYDAHARGRARWARHLDGWVVQCSDDAATDRRGRVQSFPDFRLPYTDEDRERGTNPWYYVSSRTFHEQYEGHACGHNGITSDGLRGDIEQVLTERCCGSLGQSPPTLAEGGCVPGLDPTAVPSPRQITTNASLYAPRYVPPRWDWDFFPYGRRSLMYEPQLGGGGDGQRAHQYMDELRGARYRYRLDVEVSDLVAPYRKDSGASGAFVAAGRIASASCYYTNQTEQAVIDAVVENHATGVAVEYQLDVIECEHARVYQDENGTVLTRSRGVLSPEQHRLVQMPLAIDSVRRLNYLHSLTLHGATGIPECLLRLTMTAERLDYDEDNVTTTTMDLNVTTVEDLKRVRCQQGGAGRARLGDTVLTREQGYDVRTFDADADCDDADVACWIRHTDDASWITESAFLVYAGVAAGVVVAFIGAYLTVCVGQSIGRKQWQSMVRSYQSGSM